MESYVPLVDDGFNAIKETNVSGLDLCYMGSLPSGPSILIGTTARYLMHEERRAIYISALEAALSGFEIVTLALSGGLFSLIKGAEDGGGRIHIVTAEGLDDYRKKHEERMRRALLTGGSVIAPFRHGYGKDEAIEASLSLSSALITTGCGRLMQGALDNGIDTAILRSSLARSAARKAAEQGAPVIDTFSSFLAFPSCISYPDEDGDYRFGTERFGIILLK